MCPGSKKGLNIRKDAREKNKSPGPVLAWPCSCFYDELRKLFPKILDNDVARILWRVCRHGLMHQATFNVKAKQGNTISEVGLDDSGEAIDCIKSDTKYNFKISPTKFSERVIETIEKDFSTFEGSCSPNHPLPDLHQKDSGTSIDGYSGYKSGSP